MLFKQQKERTLFMENESKKFKHIYQYLIAINVLIFGIVFLFDTQLGVDTMVKFGAKVNYKIVDGEYYRLIAPMFLHWDLYHLGANMLGLYIFGRDIEIIFGRPATRSRPRTSIVSSSSRG